MEVSHTDAESHGIADDDLLTLMRTAKNGHNVTTLWEGDISAYGNDDSAADWALCKELAYWTAGNAAQMDRLFRQSELYRDKWERADYRDATIAKAIACTTEHYTPPKPREKTVSAHETGGPPPEGPAPLPTTTGHDKTPLGQLYNAEVLIELRGADLHYCYPWKKWLVWDHGVWRADGTGQVVRWTVATVKGLGARMQAWSDEAAKAMLAHMKSSLSMSNIKGSIEHAQALPAIPVIPEQLDALPWALNVTNGTLDLKTGALQPHRRDDLLTQMLPLAYDPQAPWPRRWMQFLHEIMAGNTALINFLQRAVGYSLTGSVREQVLFFLHGTGANGKSTFLGTLQALLGPYAMQAAPEMLMSRSTEVHPTERADVFGKRLVATIEVDHGRRLAESLVKQMTGGDRIRARRMREDFWEFSPTHKIWLAANHKPPIRGRSIYRSL